MIRDMVYEEIAHCVQLYRKTNDESYLKTSEPKSIRSLKVAMRLGCFLKVLENDEGVVTAWLYAGLTPYENSTQRIVQQRYYGSNLTGRKAISALVALHESLIEWSKEQQAEAVISLASHYDERLVLPRTLKKNGWDCRGYACVYKLEVE